MSSGFSRSLLFKETKAKTIRASRHREREIRGSQSLWRTEAYLPRAARRRLLLSDAYNSFPADDPQKLGLFEALAPRLDNAEIKPSDAPGHCGMLRSETRAHRFSPGYHTR